MGLYGMEYQSDVRPEGSMMRWVMPSAACLKQRKHWFSSEIVRHENFIGFLSLAQKVKSDRLLAQDDR